jgi:hypothetical protein
MVAGGVTAGVGVGVVVGGIVCGVLAKQAGDTLSRNDLAHKPFDYALYQSGQRDQILEGVLIGVGAAAVVAGTVVAIVSARGRSVTRAMVTPATSGLSVRF